MMSMGDMLILLLLKTAGGMMRTSKRHFANLFSPFIAKNNPFADAFFVPAENY